MLARSPADAAAEMHDRSFVVLPRVFSPEEVALLAEAIKINDRMTRHFKAVQQRYLSGSYPSFESIFVWNDTSGEDLFAQFTRRRIILETLESFFADDVYVYHNKVALKYPDMPGFRFHQDYFYWYEMGCLFPDLATCYIAVDPATLENGCLRLIEGSHRIGRMNHVEYGHSDSGADPERLQAVLQRCKEVPIELTPGDCVIFHANTLHGSDANTSQSSRLALLGCYNTRRNDPYIRSHDHPNFIVQSKLDGPVTPDMAHRLPDFDLHYRESSAA